MEAFCMLKQLLTGISDCLLSGMLDASEFDGLQQCSKMQCNDRLVFSAELQV